MKLSQVNLLQSTLSCTVILVCVPEQLSLPRYVHKINTAAGLVCILCCDRFVVQSMRKIII